MDNNDKPNFDLNFQRFKTLSDAEKEEIFAKKKAQSTNDATRLWMNCFNDYLLEKNMPNADKLSTQELAYVLYHFYSEVRKKNTDENDPNDGCFKTQTLK